MLRCWVPRRRGKTQGVEGSSSGLPETAPPLGDVCDSSLLGPCVKGPFLEPIKPHILLVKVLSPYFIYSQPE